jgi:hypothetical protein
MGLGTTLGMPDNLSELEAMWCLQFPFFCSTATVQASQALMTPGLVYSPVSPLPAPSAPADPSNPSVDAAIAAANAQGQANFAATVSDTSANITAVPVSSGFDWSSIPTWLWLVLGGGVFFLMVAPSGGPRIYGR